MYSVTATATLDANFQIPLGVLEKEAYQHTSLQTLAKRTHIQVAAHIDVKIGTFSKHVARFDNALTVALYHGILVAWVPCQQSGCYLLAMTVSNGAESTVDGEIVARFGNDATEQAFPNLLRFDVKKAVLCALQ